MIRATCVLMLSMLGVVVLLTALPAPECVAAPEKIVAVVHRPLEEQHRAGSTEIPSGQVKYAQWDQLYLQVTRSSDNKIRVEVFIADKGAKLPTKASAFAAPNWISERQALLNRKKWRSVSGGATRCFSLNQGDDPDGIVVIGVHMHPDKRGGAVLYWRFGRAPTEPLPFLQPIPLTDEALAFAYEEFGLKREPETFPAQTKRGKPQAMVLRKGKQLIVCVHVTPPKKGGDPYARLYAETDPGAEKKVQGAITIGVEKLTKSLDKTLAALRAKAREKQEFDPRINGLLVHVEASTFFVRVRREPDRSYSYLVHHVQ